MDSKLTVYAISRALDALFPLHNANKESARALITMPNRLHNEKWISYLINTVIWGVVCVSLWTIELISLHTMENMRFRSGGFCNKIRACVTGIMSIAGRDLNYENRHGSALKKPHDAHQITSLNEPRMFTIAERGITLRPINCQFPTKQHLNAPDLERNLMCASCELENYTAKWEIVERATAKRWAQ